jgi:hypothetical protein
MHTTVGGVRPRVCAVLLAAALSFAPAVASGQEVPPPPPAGGQGPQPQASLLRVFLDCQYECDTEYLRQNVEFVDYVRDRAVADVHVLVTTQGTGGGGTAWTVKFIGLIRFQGQDRTLTFNTPTTASSDDRRREFARVFRLGIAGYAAETSVAPQLDVTWKKPATQAQATPARDPWNFWVFRVSGNGNLSGEQTNKSRSFRVSFSASRTTDHWKMNLSGNRDVSRSTFDFDGGDRIVSKRDSWSVTSLIVRSAGAKLSFGIRAGVSHSSFSNTDMSVNLAPGIEFDFFPYSESSRRSLTVQYNVGGSHYDYRDLTVFDRLTDTLPNHSVTVSLGLRQPWGSVGLQSSFHQHLNNRARYRTGVFGDADVRLFKGFSFNVFAAYDKIADQIGLPKGSASTEEVLLRLRQLQTNYSYFTGFGITYSFGSIFNSVVNPRFGGSGGVIFF